MPNYSYSDISRILNGSRFFNYDEIIFQRRREVLDSEQNLTQKMSTEKLKDLLKHVLKIESGFSTKSNFSNFGPNQFYMGANTGDTNRTLVNGMILELCGTNSIHDYQNLITLPSLPSSGQRTDFVWLEVWVSELIPGTGWSDGYSKPEKINGVPYIYKFGNTKYGGDNLLDQIQDQSLGVDTTTRAQIQYEIRTAANASDFTALSVFSKDGVHHFLPAVDPVTQEILPYLYVAENTDHRYGRFENDIAFDSHGNLYPEEGNQHNTHGWQYAIPICSVIRQYDEINVAQAGVTDLRQSIGITALDPDLDYIMNGLLIQNNGGDATLTIYPTDSSDKSRIVFKRGQYVVGTIEAFALGRVGIGNTSQTEFISFDTANNRVGIGITDPGGHVEIHDTTSQTPLLITNTNDQPSLDIINTGTGQGVLIENNSGSTITNILEISENGSTKFGVDSNGVVKTQAGKITTTGGLNDLDIYAEGSNALNLGKGGGSDVVVYDDEDHEVARWNNASTPLTLELGKDSTNVTFGGGYLALGTSTGMNILHTGQMETDGSVTVSNEVMIATGKTGDSDGYLKLGLEGGNFENWLKWNSVLNQFEFNKPVALSGGSGTLIVDKIQTNELSNKLGAGTTAITVDSPLNFNNSVLGGYSRITLYKYASDVENTPIIQYLGIGGTNTLAVLDSEGDLIVNNLQVNGTETIQSITTIDSIGVETQNLSSYHNSNLGIGYSDVTNIIGKLYVRKSSGGTRILNVDNNNNIYAGVAINDDTILDPSSNNNIWLKVSGGIGSLYNSSTNATPNIWVGSSFSASAPVYGGFTWSNGDNSLRINGYNNGVFTVPIIMSSGNLGIGTNPNKGTNELLSKVTVEGNLTLDTWETIEDRYVEFRNRKTPGGGENNSTRIRYESSSNKLKFERLSGNLAPSNPNVVFDMYNSYVGIGTFSPDTALHINNSKEYGLHIGSNWGYDLYLGSMQGVGYFGSNLLYDGHWQFGKGFSNSYGGAHIFENITGEHVFYTTTTTGSNFATAPLNAIVNYQANGNVGIGTKPPVDTGTYGKALDIQGSTGSAIYLRKLNTTTNYGLIAYDGTNGRCDIGAVGSNQYLRILSGSNETMRITSGGYVGINTIIPAALLSVRGAVGTGPSTTDKGIIFIDSGSNIGLGIGNYSTSPNSLWIQGISSSLSAATIYPICLNPLGGNVGIGTMAPQGILHILSNTDLSGYNQLQITNSNATLANNSVLEDIYASGLSQTNNFYYLRGRIGAGTTEWSIAKGGITILKGLLNADGGINVLTNKFIVNTSGNGTFDGTLRVNDLLYANGGINVNSSKFVVDAATGNTTIATTGLLSPNGGINVNSGNFLVNTAGIGTFVGLLNANGGINVNSSKFVVDSVTGNTTIASTGLLSPNGGINVNSSKFVVDSVTGNTTIASTGLLSPNGGINVNSSKFVVDSATGNTTIASTGLLSPNGGINVNSSKFVVDSANGNINTIGIGTFVGLLNANSGINTSGAINSTLASGTAPITVTSTTMCTKLNADQLDGEHGSAFHDAGNLNAGTIPSARLNSAYTALTAITVSGQITSTLADGTKPLVVTSTTLCNNLNADQLDGEHGFAFHDAGNLNAGTIPSARLNSAYTALTAITVSGQITSTLADGTKPLVVTSTTLCDNLNADKLDGEHGSAFHDAGNLTGTVNTARISGSYTGITAVGTLTGLTVSPGVSYLNGGINVNSNKFLVDSSGNVTIGGLLNVFPGTVSNPSVFASGDLTIRSSTQINFGVNGLLSSFIDSTGIKGTINNFNVLVNTKDYIIGAPINWGGEKRFRNLTINHTLTIDSGLHFLILYISETLTINELINGVGCGASGGTGHISHLGAQSPTNGIVGYGIATGSGGGGGGGFDYNLAGSNGKSGGGIIYQPPLVYIPSTFLIADPPNNGGTGATSNLTSGGPGSNGYSASDIITSFSDTCSMNIYEFLLKYGSGGGASGYSIKTDTADYYSASGGSGGGSLIIYAKNINFIGTGSINCSGANGADGVSFSLGSTPNTKTCTTASGGGGGGGSIFIFYQNETNMTGKLSATGGVGGAVAAADLMGGRGGTGGAGSWFTYKI